MIIRIRKLYVEKWLINQGLKLSLVKLSHVTQVASTE